MNLFPPEPSQNLLPFDGIANYYGPILTPSEAKAYLNALLTTLPWRNDEAVICGKHIVTARKVAWYGDSSYSYTYSGTTKIALTWTKELRALKNMVEDRSGCTFIRAFATCTMMAVKGWRGTVMTKRRWAEIRRLALSASVQKEDFPFDTSTGVRI